MALPAPFCARMGAERHRKRHRPPKRLKCARALSPPLAPRRTRRLAAPQPRAMSRLRPRPPPRPYQASEEEEDSDDESQGPPEPGSPRWCEAAWRRIERAWPREWEAAWARNMRASWLRIRYWLRGPTMRRYRRVQAQTYGYVGA